MPAPSRFSVARHRPVAAAISDHDFFDRHRHPTGSRIRRTSAVASPCYSQQSQTLLPRAHPDIPTAAGELKFCSYERTTRDGIKFDITGSTHIGRWYQLFVTMGALWATTFEISTTMFSTWACADNAKCSGYLLIVQGVTAVDRRVVSNFRPLVVSS